jgi:hypothetical protein
MAKTAKTEQEEPKDLFFANAAIEITEFETTINKE